MKHQDIIEKLSLEEKASLLSGSDVWHTEAIERLGIPKIMMTDGPHGLRKQTEENVGVHDSVKATCFPTAVTTASSWDEDLLKELGETLGEEALQEEVSIVLGPGCNIKRSPLCGRNFEYFSEDPYLAGHMAKGFINGVQSKGVGTSLKHFAANNQEKRRMNISSCMDERTLREIYLTQFEIAVKLAKPTTLMCSYNKINDVYSSENPFILNKILREEWGYEGAVMTDWGAVNNRPLGVASGLDLEMPGSAGLNDAEIVKAVNEGRLSTEDLDKAVDNMLELILKAKENLKKDYKYDIDKHDKIARKIASESAVLLKNEKNTLPLDTAKSILVIGALAETPRYQGAGSSHICAHKVTSVLDAFKEANVKVDYLPGYYLDNKDNTKLVEDALNKASEHDTIIIVAGLPDDYEAEGFDRQNLELPESHIKLIHAIGQLRGKKIVLNLECGAPVAMPWINDVDAILLSYLGGQATGGAAVDLMLGKVNPSGRLAETFPLELKDIPCYEYFPGDGKSVQYREGIYVGYRYYTTANKDTLYPFGYGLTYSEFKYNSLKLDTSKYKLDEDVHLTVSITNEGNRDGKEVVQIYVSPKSPKIDRPVRELKAFKKVLIKGGETVDVDFTLDKRSFAYYDVKTHDWVVDKGDYDIIVAKNAINTTFVSTITFVEGNEEDKHLSEKSWYNNPNGNIIPDEDFKELLNAELPTPYVAPKKGEFIPDHCFADMMPNSFLARRVASIIHFALRKMMHVKKGDSGLAMMYECFLNSPLRSIPATSQGILSPAGIDGMMTIFNGHFFKGLNMILKDLNAMKNKRKQSGVNPQF